MVETEIDKLASPWSCQSLYDYLYFCCPECHQKCQIKQDFVNHAINDHPVSLNFFKKIEDNSVEDVNLPSNDKTVEVHQSVIDIEIKNDEEFGSDNIANIYFEELENDDDIKTEEVEDEDDDVDVEDLSSPAKSNDEKKQPNEKETSSDFCPHCDFVDSNKDKLKRHIISVHSGKFDCNFCDFKTYCQRSLDVHTNALHTKTIKFSCGECKFFSYAKGGLQSHNRNIHLKVKRDNFKCEYCEFKTSSQSHLDKHTNAIHTKAVKFHCEQCEFFSYSRSGVQSHVKTVHLKIKRLPKGPKKSILCTLCGQAFELTRNLKIHEFKKHGIASEYTSKRMGDVKIQCDKCQETFDTTSTLNNHAKSCSNDNIKTFPCTLCEMQVVAGNVFLIHMKIDHSQINAVLCDLCGRCLCSRGALSYHLKATHEKKFDSICETCGKCFANDSWLKDHIKTVHKDGGVKCDYCEKKFNSKSNKRAHENRFHTKKNQYPCDQCDFVAFIKFHLNSHKQRVHEKIKNVPCPQCDQKVINNYELKRHIMIFHVGKYACDKCDFKGVSKKS